MTDLAINDKGEAMAFDGKAWKPAPIAENDKGERMAFDGQQWRALPKAEKPGAFDSTLKTADAALDFVNRNVINPIGTGLTKGTTAMLGAPRMAADLLQAGATWAGDKLGAPETGRKIGAGARFIIPGGTAPSAEDYNRAIFGSLAVPEENFGDKPALTLTNPFGLEGKVNVGKMMDTGIQAIPGAMAMGGGVLPSVMGGVTSEAAGQATQGTPYELPARIFGSLPGAWLGSKVTTPLPANLTPQEARAVQIAKETGTPLSVAQETGRGAKMESALARFPTSAGPFDRLAARQGATTDKAALKTMGFEGDEVGVETMKAAKRQAGGAFDDARNATTRVELQPDFYNKAGRSIATYTENTAPSEIIKGVANKLDDYFDPKLMKGGAFPELSGTQYQEFRSGITKSVDALYKNGKPGAADALKGVRDALDDAAQASLPAELSEAWKTARRNYYNFKIIEKAAARGTAESRSSGTLSPSGLTSVLRQKQGDAFATTTGGLNDVATLKQYLKDTFPNSGTPTMQAWQGLLSGGSALGAAGLGGGAAVGALAPSMAIPAAAALVTPNLLARAMTGGGPISSVVRNYLANQVQPSRLDAVSRVPFALAPGLLTDQRVRQ